MRGSARGEARGELEIRQHGRVVRERGGDTVLQLDGFDRKLAGLDQASEGYVFVGGREVSGTSELQVIARGSEYLVRWEQTGHVLEALRAECGDDCEVRRVQFAPGGADVTAL